MDRSSDYTLFVNSTDTFSDTWEPFFTLLAKFWPHAAPVVLNTERRTFSHADVDVVCTQVARPGESSVPWGECMLRALDTIPTEKFVYLQDDYFLYAPVKWDVVDAALDAVDAEDLDCLRLMECDGSGPWSPTANEWFWSVDRRARYRIALQAGIWTKTGMRTYVRRHESPWQFEIWGSKRAARIDRRIWCVNRDLFEEELSPVVPYVPTGIVKGRWNRDAVEHLFATHDIRVDYGVRGWWDPATYPYSTFAQKLAKLPRFAFDRVRSL